MFSGKEDFLYFAEQFEARIFHLKLTKVINREVDEKDFAPNVRNNAIVEQIESFVRKGREILGEKNCMYGMSWSDVYTKILFCF